MKKLLLTAVVLAHNEAENLKRCLRSLSFVTEIVVVDDNSTDSTTKIAEEYNANVVKRALEDDFAAQRNAAEAIAQQDWLLYIDADEEVSQALAESIEIALDQKEQAQAYYLHRRDFYAGHELRFGEVRDVRDQGLIRLVKKGSGHWVNAVHEEFIIKKEHSTGELRGFINHYPHPSLSLFLSDINHYSTLRARELTQKRNKIGVTEILLYPLGKFLYTYFWLQGYRDGVTGFTYSFMMSFHSFLVRAKLYQYLNLDNKKK